MKNNSFTISPNIVSDILDGEAVLINLESGNYYNMQGLGAEIWAQLDGGVTFESLLAWVSEKYAVANQQAEQDLTAFFEQMKQEGLIVAQGEPASNGPANVLPEWQGPVDGNYVAPTLTVFTDMQEFLLVDPIHEVDEFGLPKRPNKG